ncbi:MAG: diguanylate cyclase [Pseudomonadota bacterium]
MTSKTEEKDWKSLYRDLLRELEEKEKDWTNIESVLRTTVIKLSLAAMGQSPALDKRLDRIKSAAKNDARMQTLDRDVAALTKVLTQLDLAESEKTPTKTQEATQPSQWFVDLLIKSRSKLKNSEAMESLIREVRANQLPLEQAVARFTALLPSPVEPKNVQANNPSSAAAFADFINSLKLPPSLSQSLPTEAIPNQDYEQVLAQLSEELNRLLVKSEAATDPHIQQPSSANLTQLITLLLKEFENTPELKDSMGQILGKLDDGVTDEDWPELLSELADCIAEAIHGVRAEKTELEKFLDEVTKQLAQFEDWAKWSQTQVEQGHDDSLELQDAMTSEFQILQHDVDATTDLTELKSKVTTRLDAVANQIKNFREREDTRLKASLEKNTELTKEIEGLKGKTNKIVKLWGQQRTRLMYDTLTRVYSRYAYDQKLMEEFHRWKRHGEPLVFSIWDIDRFKRINDTYGHRAGDRLLQMVAKILSENTRTEDFVARIGGEEFVMLLPSTPSDVALGIANKLRECVSTTQFHYKGCPEEITISCGLTAFKKGDTPLQVYNRADQALYEAKSKGRDCCISA